MRDIELRNKLFLGMRK